MPGKANFVMVRSWEVSRRLSCHPVFGRLRRASHALDGAPIFGSANEQVVTRLS
jgi:hypothetical protein